MNRFTRFLFLASVALLGGCASRPAPFDPVNEAIVVIGVKPGDYVFNISLGVLQHEHWKRLILPPLFLDSPHDGYIVARLPADELLAIAKIRTADRRRHYTWCGGNFMPTFTLPAGHVVYLSNFEYKWPQGMMPWYTTTEDFDAARAFVDANYPEWRGKLEQGVFKGRQATFGCSARDG